jgi:hypothetical protein
MGVMIQSSGMSGSLCHIDNPVDRLAHGVVRTFMLCGSDDRLGKRFCVYI